MNQYKFFELDLNTNYANKVLSYYLWGMDDPPSKTNLISENWIDRAKTDQIVLNIDTRSFLDKTGLYQYHPYEFGVIRKFFNNEHENGSKDFNVLKNGNLQKFSNGELSLTYNEIRSYL